MMMKKHALIMAGGVGRRAGGELPKQFTKLLGIPMLWWSVMAFHKEDATTEITIVMHPDFFDDYARMLEELPSELRNIDVKLAKGGNSRGESVKNGIKSIASSKESLIAVHDAARPLVTTRMITEGWQLAAQEGNAVPCCQVTDSIRIKEERASKAVDRSRFVSVQTPQVVRADILHNAYKLEEKAEFTDDASRVEALGLAINLYDGEPRNIKVTNPDDFAIAEALLKKYNN